uniref:Wsv324-like protein n=1 Tax=Hemigrapsus takanoi nimavirus TaxID=2133792 RepID=A0A401IP25_9VIRU|nr:MAG: wsv324-like protein [Hemigrapsus takanoi nimavirus]GBG35351.1 wsv324-like protein [Hemigrapsus takanoi nimavirus]
MAFKIKKPMNVASVIARFKEKEDDDTTGVSAMVFEYASVGLGKPDLFFSLSYNNNNATTLGRRNTSIRGKSIIVNEVQRRRPAPERTNVLVDKDTNNAMLLAMDEDLEKRVSDLFTPAIKINQGCPVWNFVVSA